MVEKARSMELPVIQGSRGYVFNADMVALVELLNIGTDFAPAPERDNGAARELR